MPSFHNFKCNALYYEFVFFFKINLVVFLSDNTCPEVTITCTGWIIGLAVVVVLLLFLLALLVWKFRPTCALDHPIQAQVNRNPTARFVVNPTLNGNVNFGKNNSSKETLDEVDDVPMLEP